MRRTWVSVVVALLALATALGCSRNDSATEGGEGADPHAALVAEFEGYKKQHCACPDFACMEELGKTVGPRVQELMANEASLPRDVNFKLGMILKDMTECAMAKQP